MASYTRHEFDHLYFIPKCALMYSFFYDLSMNSTIAAASDHRLESVTKFLRI